MKGFFSWFNSKTKIKRYILLILIGICLTCFAIATIIETNILKPEDIIKITSAFVVGFLAIVLGFIFMQRRVLEILIEANNTTTVKGRNANLNIKGLIFNKTMYNEGPKVVVIGGGNGLNTVIRGLKKYTNNITAIVTMSEEKPETAISPYGEMKDSIIALSDKEDLMGELLNWEFDNKRLRGLNFGDIYLTAMNEIYSNPAEGIRMSTEILNITGIVIPATLDDIKICAELEDGTVVEGKDKIPQVAYDKITKIKRVYISPSNCQPAPGVLEEIKNADAIIIGPGSLYTNVLPSLLVKNISTAIKESSALKIYITNIMTEPGQTDNYSISDHLEALFNHVGKDIIDYCISDTGEIMPEFVRKYNKEGQDLVLQDIDKATKKGIKVIHRSLSKIENDYIRHDPDLIAAAIMELICNDLKYRDKESTPKYILANSILEDELKREKKESKKIRKQRQKIEKAKQKGKIRKSKFNAKYHERIESIQTTVEKKNENQKLYKKMEKLDK